MLKTEYFYENFARFGFGLENPNHAAALIAFVIPILWTVQSAARSQQYTARLWVTYILELILIICLCLTLSRGGILAVGMAALLFCRERAVAYRSVQTCLWNLSMFVVRGLVLMSVLISIGGIKRLSSVIGSDPSVTHRLELWRGGLELAYLRPFCGWGAGKSGIAFIQWIQPTNEHFVTFGMVNSYLQVAVEFGLPVLWMLLVLMNLIIAYCMSNSAIERPPRPQLLRGLGLGLVAYSIAALFSTLWTDWATLIPPVLGTGTVIFLALLRGRNHIPALVHKTKTAVVFATASVASVYFAGSRSAESSSTVRSTVSSANSRYIELSGPSGRRQLESAATHNIVVVVDKLTLGFSYGQRLRDLMDSMPDSQTRMTVYNIESTPQGIKSETLILTGYAVHKYSRDWNANAIIFICPIGNVPRNFDRKANTVLIVPEYDQFGYTEQWKRWAKMRDVELHIVHDCGQDISSEATSIVRGALFGVKTGIMKKL